MYREWMQKTSRHCSQQSSEKTSEGKKVTQKFPAKLDRKACQRSMHCTIESDLLLFSCKTEDRAGILHAG